MKSILRLTIAALLFAGIAATSVNAGQKQSQKSNEASPRVDCSSPRNPMQ